MINLIKDRVVCKIMLNHLRQLQSRDKRLCSSVFQTEKESGAAGERFIFPGNFNEERKNEFRCAFALHEDFISEEEEASLLKEVEPHLTRQVYQKDHWDNAIQVAGAVLYDQIEFTVTIW